MRAKIEEPVEYHERCPKCGCVLITDGHAVWCTFVGGRSEPGCDFQATLRMEPETDPAVEALAAYAHDAWSSDVERIFLLSDRNEDGSVTIDAQHAKRWHRKMNTPYAELSEGEKEAERSEARKILEIMSSIHRDGAKRAVGGDVGVRKYKVADYGRMLHLEPND